MRRFLALALLLVAGLMVTGCGESHHVTIKEVLAAEGFNPSGSYPLLALEKIKGEESTATGSLSNSWFFLWGSGSGSLSSHNEPSTSLGFTITSGSNRVSILQIPYPKLTFVFDPAATTPRVHFLYDGATLFMEHPGDNLWKNSNIGGNVERKKAVLARVREMSIAQLITYHLRTAIITLSQATFSRDVSPLINQTSSAPAVTSQPTP